MRVLHISRGFLPLYGGTERHIAEIAKRMGKLGVVSRILTLRRAVGESSAQLADHEILEDMEVFRISAIGHHKKPLPLRIPLSLFRWAHIVHVHDLRVFYETALLLKPVYGFKLVYSTHGFLLHTADLLFLKRCLIRAYYLPTLRRWADAVVCDSEQDFALFRGYGVPRLCLVTNGVDVRRFGGLTRRPVAGELLYFGRLDRNKGLDLLLRGLALVKNEPWHLKIVGGGADSIVRGLKDLSRTLGLEQRVTWCGPISEHALLEALQTCQLCVFPSRYEGFGLTLLEAMAAGCPCLVNRISAYEERVDDGGNAFLVDFANPHVAARVIEALLEKDVEELSEVGRQAKTTAQPYDWEYKVRDLFEVYKRVLR